MERYFVGPIEEFISENRMLISIDGGAVLVERPTGKGILDKIRGDDKSKRKPQRISRPPNAYILYRKDHHQMIKAAHPSYTNNDISKVLGSAWKNESEEVREKYHRMANEIKQDLMRAHPEYRYTPRRPHERRRRARRVQTGNV
ncbi:hypothetical protein ACRALDRAFT_2097723 [Sodiomyces alcalophilus JCM 7366]|uniref:uncharacterized protein n=1 Tax=Sodiomyces alcalophilus JCM 7366 TaxID=591952 RepID=UPI0039B5AED8